MARDKLVALGLLVVGPVLTASVSMNFGFNAVLCLAALLYGAAFAALSAARRVPVTRAVAVQPSC